MAMMFKRTLVIGFAAMYFLISTGFHLEIHRCLGEVKSVTLLAKVGDSCCHKEDAKNPCCSEVEGYVQFEAYRTFIETPEPEALSKFYTHPISPLVETITFLALNDVRHSDLPDPPLILQEPIWLQNCSLVYYG